MENIPKTLIHGTITGLVDKALDHSGLYGPGFNPKNLEGYPIYFSFPGYERYCEKMAKRIIKGQSESQGQIRSLMENYSLGEIIILEFQGSALPPVHYVKDELSDNQLFTNNQIFLNMLIQDSKKKVISIFRDRATKYFDENPLNSVYSCLRIAPASLKERLSLFNPEEREEMIELFEKFKCISSS